MFDIVIHGGLIITMEGDGVGIIENGGLATEGNRIAFVGNADEVKNSEAKKHIYAGGKVVMPGLIDAHVHTGFGLLRGLSQDIGAWMQKGLWPFYDGLDGETASAGSRLAIIEAVKAGTTTFNDFFGGMAALAENHAKLGTRAIVTEMVNEMLKKLTDNATGLYKLEKTIGREKKANAVELYKKYDGACGGRITCGFGVQAADMLSEDLLMEMYEEAMSKTGRFMIHVEQGDREIDQMMKRHGKRTIPYLEDLGMLNEHLLAVHLTETAPEDAAALARKKCRLLHCAGTISLIDGINPPVGEFAEAGGMVALGSDHVPGNNCSNMFSEMKLTALLNKVKYHRPDIFPAWKLLRMCTCESAEVLGMSGEIGSLRKGKKADIIIIDTGRPELTPVVTYPFRNIIPNLVYAANGSEVETSIIDGKVIMEERRLLTANEEEIIGEAQEKAVKLAERGAEFMDEESDMLKMYRKGLL